MNKSIKTKHLNKTLMTNKSIEIEHKRSITNEGIVIIDQINHLLVA
jgi:hypothetical protein